MIEPHKPIDRVCSGQTRASCFTIQVQGKPYQVLRHNRQRLPLLKFLPFLQFCHYNCFLSLNALCLRFTNGMVYYGAAYGASDLGGSMYLNFVLTSLIEIPANVLVIDNCQR